MVDETMDLSNTEQMVLCLHYVDDSLEVHEEFVGLYSLESTSCHCYSRHITLHEFGNQQLSRSMLRW